MTDTCAFCGQVVVDGRDVSGFTGEGPDWMTPSGDFGCGESPETHPEEGVGGHAVSDGEVHRATFSPSALEVVAYHQRQDARRAAWQEAAAVVEAARACLPDLKHYAATHGPGPDRRLDNLLEALEAYAEVAP